VHSAILIIDDYFRPGTSPAPLSATGEPIGAGVTGEMRGVLVVAGHFVDRARCLHHRGDVPGSQAADSRPSLAVGAADSYFLVATLFGRSDSPSSPRACAAVSLIRRRGLLRSCWRVATTGGTWSPPRGRLTCVRTQPRVPGGVLRAAPPARFAGVLLSRSVPGLSPGRIGPPACWMVFLVVLTLGWDRRRAAR
jgi:hypothetical protein